jgi:hypothetical protein
VFIEAAENRRQQGFYDNYSDYEFPNRNDIARVRLIIATVQFIALGLTLMVMVGYYSYYGWNIYNRRVEFESNYRPTVMESRKQSSHWPSIR